MEIMITLGDNSTKTYKNWFELSADRENIDGNISSLKWKHLHMFHDSPGKNSAAYCFINRARCFSSGQNSTYFGIGYSKDGENFIVTFLGEDGQGFVEQRHIDKLDKVQVFYGTGRLTQPNS